MDRENIQAPEPRKAERRRLGEHGRRFCSAVQLHALELGVAGEELHDGLRAAVDLAAEIAEGRHYVPCESAHDQASRVRQFLIGWCIDRSFRAGGEAEAPQVGEKAQHLCDPGGPRGADPAQGQVDAPHRAVGRVDDDRVDPLLKVACAPLNFNTQRSLVGSFRSR